MGVRRTDPAAHPWTRRPAASQIIGSFQARRATTTRRWPSSEQGRALRVQATLTKRDFSFHDMAPQLTYSFTRNVSSSPLDDDTALDLRLVKDF
jgi:hypothetical protein